MGSLESENREKRELDDGEDVNDDGPPAKRLAESPPEETQCVSLLDLSDDVLLMILKHCTPIELKALGFTCERLGYLIQDHTLWHSVDARDVPYGRKRFHWLLNVALSDSTRELKLAGFATEPIGKRVIDRTVHDKEEEYNPDMYVHTSKSTQTSDNDFESFSNKPLTRLKSVTKNISSPGSSMEQAGSSSANPKSEDEKEEKLPIFTFTHEMLTQLSAQCKNLTTLYLEYCNINNMHTDLGCFPRTLKELSLKGTRIYNVPFEKSFLYKAVDYLDSLEYLDVSECNWMEGHVLLSISKMSKLKTLIMRNCLRMYEFVAYASLAGRYGFKQLQVMDVRGSPFCDSELTAFGWLPMLQEIYLAPQAPRSAAYATEDTPEQFPWEAEEPECFQFNYYKSTKQSQEPPRKNKKGKDGSSTDDKDKSNKDDDKKKEYNKTVTYFWKLMCDSIEATTVSMEGADRRELFQNGGVIADRIREIRRAVALQAGRRPDGPQVGMRVAGQQDGTPAEGQQDGGRPADGLQDGTRANASQEGRPAEGLQDGRPADGLQDGKPTDGLQDGKPTDGLQDGRPADGLQDVRRVAGQQDGRPDGGQQDGTCANGSQDGQKNGTRANDSQDAKLPDGQQDDKPDGKRTDGSQEGSQGDGKKGNKHVDSKECGVQTSRQQNGAQSCSSRQDGELVDSPDVIVVHCQESGELMVRRKIRNECEVSSQHNDRRVIDESDDKRNDHDRHVIDESDDKRNDHDRHVIDESDDKRNDHKEKVSSNNDQNSHQPQPGTSQSNDQNKPGPSKSEEDNSVKGPSKRKIENEPKEVKFKRQCPLDLESPPQNGQGNLVHIIQAGIAMENNGQGQNLGPRNNNVPRNLPRNRVLYVNFGRQIPSLVYRMAIEGGVPNCTLSTDCPRLRLNNRLDGTLLVSDATVFRFGRSDHELMNMFPLGRPGNRQVDQQETGGRPNRSSLRVLSVTGYRNITDRSLHHLASSAPNLRLLDLSETNVTDIGVEAFKVMQPDCEVKYSKYKQ